jgi:hypothetical protein
MKQLMATAFLATVALFGMTQVSEANGLFRKCKGGCDSGCASAPCASAPCATVAPAPVQYEERKVKVAKQVWTDKEVEVLECKQISRQEKFVYTVCVPVTTQEKRTAIVCSTVSKQVAYDYTVMVPSTVQKKVQCTTYQCVRETVCEMVPVCKTVCVTCVDECGRCHTRRERVTVMEERTRCVTKRIPTTKEVIVNVTVCEAQVQKGKRKVCEIARSERDVVVNVCSYERQEKVGTRMVCHTETVKVKRKVNVCTTVPYETTVKVAICPTTACSTGCDSCGSCDSCGHAKRHGGLFRRGHGSSCCN